MDGSRSRQIVERSGTAEVRVAEAADAMAHAVREGHQQTIVRQAAGWACMAVVNSFPYIASTSQSQRARSARQTRHGGANLVSHVSAKLILQYLEPRGIIPLMKETNANPEFLNGVPELVILRLLSGEPMYGYELVQQIRTLSGEQLTFGEGCVYPILHRLEAQGYLQSKRENVGGRSRVVYRLTRQGKTRLTQIAAEWQRIVAAVGVILQGGTHGNPGIAANPA